jgi:hypothetical protein
MTFGFFQRIFEKYVNMKYNKNAASSCVSADGQTDRQTGDRQTDMTQLIVGFRNFPNAPKTMQIEWQYSNGSLTYCKLTQNNDGNNNNNNNNNNNIHANLNYVDIDWYTCIC